MGGFLLRNGIIQGALKQRALNSTGTDPALSRFVCRQGLNQGMADRRAGHPCPHVPARVGVPDLANVET